MFDKNYFSSIANQQISGERIQTWQYETVDDQEDLIANDYFAHMQRSLKVNDIIKVIHMDFDRKNATLRYDLIVRVNEILDGTHDQALVALPETLGSETHLLNFDNISLSSTQSITLDVSSDVIAAYAVFLGKLDAASATLAITVKSQTTPTTVASGTYNSPVNYGQMLKLVPGSADSDSVFHVTITPTGIPPDTGMLKIFLVTKIA